MRSSDVLIDVGWALERDDLECILHVDRARHDVIASAFDGKGPPRVVKKASMTRDGFKCSSFGDERLQEGAAELMPYLRHAYIKTFEIDYCFLYADATRSLLALKEYFVIDTLDLSSNAFDLIDGALVCWTLIWQQSGYTHDEVEWPQYQGTYEDYDEKEIVEHEERFGFLEDFFKLRTVRNAESLWLENVPYLHGKVASRWLHGDDGVGYYDGAKELHRFRADTESREYKFVASGGLDCTSWIQSRKLENDAGDVFEVELMRTCSDSVTVTRYRGENAKRSTLTQNMDGPKVWDFCTASELEKYILGDNVYELLARSGLVANEMICKCGSRMQLQIKQRDIGAAIWRCSESCTNGYGETFHVLPTCMSRFWNLDRDRDVATVLKRVILLVREGPNSSGPTKLDDDAPRYWKKLLEQYDELLKHVENHSKNPIEGFYAAVLRKYPYDGAYRLPVLKYWEY